MHLPTMTRSLNRHRIPALMLIFEMALACAVLGNVLHMLVHRIDTIHLADGVDESRLAAIMVDNRDAGDNVDTIDREWRALAGIAGVRSVAQSNSVPFSHDAWEGGLRIDPSGNRWINASTYLLGRDGMRTLGLHLRQGQSFHDQDYAHGGVDPGASPTSPVVILSSSLADRLWPGQNALGRNVYDSAGRHVVIGVVDDVIAPELGINGPSGNYYTAFYPSMPSVDMRYYLLNAVPTQMGRILSQARVALEALHPNALISVRDFPGYRRDYFASDRSMIWMLSLVSVVMLAATGLGVIGLTSFWVGQRRVQIGIRRALGARRLDVLVYFQVENLLLSLLGGGLGVLVGYGLSLYLMRHYEFGQLPFVYLWAGALVLLLLGQLAVLGPALKAGRISPVVAMRHG